MRHANVPPAFVIVQRINLGLVRGPRRRSARPPNWRRLAEEMWPWVEGPPSTPLGELEHRWRSRLTTVAADDGPDAVDCAPGFGTIRPRRRACRLPCTMDFDLPPELAELQASVRKLAQERVAPRAREIDLTEEYPAGPLRAVRRDRPGRALHPRGVRRLRRRDPRARHRHRGGREVLQRRRPDAPAHPAADRPAADRGQRGDEAQVPHADRHGRAAGRVRALGAPGRQRRHGHAHQGGARRRRLGHQRHEVLDVRGAPGRLVLRVRQDGAGRLPRPRQRHRVRRRAGLGRRLGRPRRQEDGREGRRHRRAAARRGARPGGERRRRHRRLPALHARAERDAPDRRGAGHRPRRGRADVRGRVREAARGVHQDDRRLPGHPVEDRRARDRDRGRAAAHLPRRVDGGPGPVHEGVRARTCRCASTTRPSSR